MFPLVAEDRLPAKLVRIRGEGLLTYIAERAADNIDQGALT